MRTYLILRERARQWRADAEIQAIVAELGRDHGAPALSKYSTAHRHMLLATPFDRAAIASKGLGYERLDQLTMELLLGVRGEKGR
jgi:xylose isomerase